MKIKKFYYPLFIAFLGFLSFSILTLSSLSITSNSFNLIKKDSNKISNIGSQKQKYNDQNALQMDVQEKATSDSTIIYYINWIGISPRLMSASHLIKILEINPNKEVYFVIRKNVKMNLLDSEINQNKSKYPNFNFIMIEDPLIDSIQSIKNQDYFPLQISDIIKKLNSENKKIDFYCDDYLILNPINNVAKNLENVNYYNKETWNKIIDNLVSNFSKIKNMNSVNIFADGTISMNFFSSTIYKSFLFSGNAIDKSKNEYLSESLFLDKHPQVNTVQDLILFLLSIVSTNEKGSNISKTKYFLPTVEMVNEANLANSQILATNEKDFFNPYNSLEADLLSFCQGIQHESLNLLNKIFSNNLISESNFEFMNNNNNYIYSGALLEDGNKITEESLKLLQIKKEIEEQGIKKYNIIFKGHPRNPGTVEQIQNSLRKEVKKLSGDDAKWLYVVNNKIPYELYLVSGIFDNNPKKNKIVKLYTTFSTINLFIYAKYPMLEIIEKILVNLETRKEIFHYFSNQSKIFPKDKFSEVN